MLKKCLWLALFLAGIFIVGACTTQQPTATPRPAAPAATPTPKVQTGGVLRVRNYAEADSFDVAGASFRAGSRKYGALFNTLVGTDENLGLKPELAESWDIAPDGKSITLKLRKGVKFHDGTDFDAKAVKFNLDRAMDPKVSIITSTLADLDSTQVVDDYTVKLIFKKPSAPLLAYLGEAYTNISSPTAIEKWGKDYSKHPVGTGPFMFKEWVLDDHMTVDKFPQYWEKDEAGNQLPYLDQIIFKPMPDETAGLVALKTGTIDMFEFVPNKDVASIKGDSKLDVLEKPGMTWVWYQLNLKHAPLDNTACRQAVSYAIDREALVKAVENGVPKVSRGFASPAAWYYNTDSSFKGQYFDLAKAKDKLKECGKPDGFEFTNNVQNNPAHIIRAEAIQAMLAKVGIKMKINSLEATEWYKIDSTDQWQAEALWWTAFSDPRVAFDVYLLCEGRGGQKRHGYCNREADSLILKAESTYDRAERKKYYNQAEAIVADEAAHVYLFHDLLNMGVNKKVKGYQVQPIIKFLFTRVWMEK